MIILVLNMFYKTLFLFLALTSLLIANEDIATLQEQVQELQKRMDAQEKQKAVVELLHEDSILSVGGRIDLQTFWTSPDGSVFAGSIPLDKNSRGEDATLKMSAQDSRLWVKSRTQTPYGALRALVEIDFHGANYKDSDATTNSHTPRLRHAYMQLGGWTVGQTNSAFNSMVTLDTITYVINDTFVRQPLIRYTLNDGTTLAYDLSLEQPETTLLDKSATLVKPKDDVAPDFIARVRYYPSWGEASLALMGRYLVQNEATSTILDKDSAFGYGANFSAKIKTFNRDDIRLDAQYGLGLGRYLAYNAYAAGFVADDGRIKLQESYGWHVGYRHFWAKEWRSTLAYGYCGTKNSDAIETNEDKANKEAASVQVNLFYTPLEKMVVGGEYIYATREVASSDKGSMHTALLVFRYDF
jgi:hypothetical protein